MLSNMNNPDFKPVASDLSNSSGLRGLYFNQIDNIYCLYTHIVERFSELVDSPYFADLKAPISEMLHCFSCQAGQLELINPLLTAKINSTKCEGLTACLEEAFAPVYMPTIEPALRDTFIVSYLYYHNSLVMASCQVLQFLPENTFDIQEQQLIDSFFNEAKKGNPLITTLGAKLTTY